MGAWLFASDKGTYDDHDRDFDDVEDDQLGMNGISLCAESEHTAHDVVPSVKHDTGEDTLRQCVEGCQDEGGRDAMCCEGHNVHIRLIGSLEEPQRKVPDGPDDSNDEGGGDKGNPFFKSGLQESSPTDFLKAASEDHQGDKEDEVIPWVPFPFSQNEVLDHQNHKEDTSDDHRLPRVFGPEDEVEEIFETIDKSPLL